VKNLDFEFGGLRVHVICSEERFRSDIHVERFDSLSHFSKSGQGHEEFNVVKFSDSDGNNHYVYLSNASLTDLAKSVQKTLAEIKAMHSERSQGGGNSG